MCDVPITEKSADAKLADLMKRDLGADVTPAQVRLFVVANWRKVKAYAHSIHDQHGDSAA